MNHPLRLFEKLDCFHSAVNFFRKHFLIVLGLGLIAALGRVIQLGGFGEISSGVTIILEVVVESARVLLFLYVIGLANVKAGFVRIKKIFTHKADRRAQWSIALRNLRTQWFTLLLNFIMFSLVAWLLNYLIDQLAYETCLYLTLRENGILNDTSSEWTILLFFKNLSVIPFTLIFEAMFLLFITNKLGKYKNGYALK
ncbi:hypothetical protein [Salmonirosea aquatica]|uniref:Uncharacterized protein n=1 Tax=Salmonirosea aquatica TaxID=2654236 RepID=A0A7C9FPI8_9BACT|nr:hypothetical protein [Cytophagaceae bacterium SJW1-29]